MNESLKAFLSRASEDDELKKRIGEAMDKDVETSSEAVAALAREAGFDMSAEDVRELCRGGREEIDEEELSQVVGGGGSGTGQVVYKDYCWCVFEGEGEFRGNSYKHCTCSWDGTGETTGIHRLVPDGRGSGEVHCDCYVYGSGDAVGGVDLSCVNLANSHR